MAEQKFDRPTIELQPYAQTPRYTYHGAADDRVAILVCRIKVWRPKGTNWFDIPTGENCLVIRECESIEISNSYKELISKAVIRFPRGTIIEKYKKSDVSVAVDSGMGDGTRSCVFLDKATQNGDFAEYYMNSVQEKNGTSTSVKPNSEIVPLDGTQVDMGLTNLNKHLKEKDLLSQNDFTIGNRIEIYLGYAYSEDEFRQMQTDNGKVPENMELAFTGFITGCSVSTPLEVECENMAHVLTTINVPDIIEKGKMTMKDFLADDGKYHLLKDTGIKLASSAVDCTIEVAKFRISSNLTVADVLSNWSDYGIRSFMENNADGTSSLRVGKVYYAGKGGSALPTKDKSYITYNKESQYNIIQFDWDVASDNLSLVHSDKKYLAVRASGREKDGKEIHLTVRRTDSASGDWGVSDDDETWSVVNEKTTRPKKKSGRVAGGTKRPNANGTVYKNIKNKVDMKNYTVIPYISQTYPCTRDKLIEEAKQYWGKYVPNGISGTLTIFGDLQIKPSDIVGLIDPRQPQKNGYYLVEAVNVTFGTNGYRKELTIPYKIANFKDYPTYQL